VTPPFTGSGVFKGYQNVSGLLEHLQAEEELEGALSGWSVEQVRLADHLLALGDQMEQAFIWDPIDLRTAEADDVAAWWKAAVTFPEEFSYQVED
jgi:hypothetical protein